MEFGRIETKWHEAFKAVESKGTRSDTYTKQKRRSKESGAADMGKNYGALATVDALAGGNVLKWNDVLKMDVNTIFVKLLIDAEKSIIEARQMDIMNAENKPKK